jgi:ATP-binding cassette subfamily F protein 3
MLLVVDNVKKSFGIHDIFEDVSFFLDKGEKVGLVGVNGSGKSTLLKCLLDPNFADKGSIKFEPNTKVGYVQQGFQNIGDESLWNFMLKASPEIIELRSKLAKLEKLVASTNPGKQLDEVLANYEKVMARYEYLQGYQYEQRIKMVLIGLGFPEKMWDQNAGLFSGGQKTRAMLASSLVSAPDFLILDEPTNHLDIVMTEWLEDYLKSYKGGVIVVSHDRYFLDNVVSRIIEMEGGHLDSYKGNYTKYLAQKAIKDATIEAAYEAQQEYIQKTEDYIRRFKAGIKSKMARGRQSQLDRLEKVKAPVHKEEFELHLPPASESANKVIILEDLSAGYSDNVLVKGLNYEITRGEKVALIGANGSGKTTLLKTILGKEKPLKGRAKIGNRVQIGYFSQSYERLNPKQTLMDNFLEEYGLTDEQTRCLLGGMMFHGDDVFKEIGTLSGGQKARLVLLKLVLDGANCLVLDEPTNHLDIAAREAVEEALEAFDGTVLVVSHDRYFVREIASRIWEIEDQSVVDYKGDFDFYQVEKAKHLAKKEENNLKQGKDSKKKANLEVKESKKSKKNDETDENKESNLKKKPLKKFNYSVVEAKKRVEKVERSIREQEVLIGFVEKEMASPIFYEDLEEAAKIGKKHEEMQALIDKLMEEWEELMEIIEG